MSDRVAREIEAAKVRPKTRGDLFALLSFAAGNMTSEGIEQAIELVTALAELSPEDRLATLCYAKALQEWQD